VTPTDSALSLVADSLARNLPADAQLDQLPVHRNVLAAAKSGSMGPLLRELGVDDDVAQLATLWPRALEPALVRLERLPAPFVFRLHLAQTAAYLFLVGALELAVIGVLGTKVFPVLATISKDFGLVAMLDVQRTASVLFMLGALPLAVWVALGLRGWHRLPGWGRDYARAREAWLTTALLDASPPEDVRSAWLAKAQWVKDATLVQVDLETLARESSSAAERGMARFVALVRVLGLALLTLNAAGVLLAVYGTVARLAEAQP